MMDHIHILSLGRLVTQGLVLVHIPPSPSLPGEPPEGTWNWVSIRAAQELVATGRGTLVDQTRECWEALHERWVLGP